MAFSRFSSRILIAGSNIGKRSIVSSTKHHTRSLQSQHLYQQRRGFLDKVKNALARVMGKDPKEIERRKEQEEMSMLGNIVIYGLKKIIESVGKQVVSEMKQMKNDMETLTNAVNDSVNSDPKARRILGNDIRIGEIRSVSSESVNNNGVSYSKFDLKNIRFIGSEGSCTGSVIASNKGAKGLEIIEIKLHHHNEIINIRPKAFSSKIIDIQM